MKKWLVLNNKGVSLVELIVTIAIMSIVGGVITAFVVVSQRNYNSGSAETDLQYEAQLVVNQMQDLLMDTSKGVSYSYQSGGSSQYIKDDSEIPSGQAVTGKSLFVYNKDVYYELRWNAATKEIRLLQFDSVGGSFSLSSLSAEGDLLGEFISDFQVDLRDTSDNGTVKYVIHMEKSGTNRSYRTAHQIRLRNKVMVNAASAEVYR